MDLWSKGKILKDLEDAISNVGEAIDMIEDDDLDQAIFELEIALGSLDERIKELKKEES